MEHGWKHWLGVCAAATVLASGLASIFHRGNPTALPQQSTGHCRRCVPVRDHLKRLAKRGDLARARQPAFPQRCPPGPFAGADDPPVTRPRASDSGCHSPGNGPNGHCRSSPRARGLWGSTSQRYENEAWSSLVIPLPMMLRCRREPPIQWRDRSVRSGRAGTALVAEGYPRCDAPLAVGGGRRAARGR
jgi:hypothetical protein